MIALFLFIGFWALFAYAIYATDEPKFPLICAAIWLIALGVPYLFPALYLASLIIRYILPVLLAVWLKIHDTL